MTQTCQAQPCSFFPTSPVTSGQCLLPTGTVPQPLGSPEGAARPCPAPSSGEGAAVPCFSGLAACGSRDTARPWSLPGSRGPAKPRPLGLCPGWCPARAAGTPRHSSASGPAVQAGRQAGRRRGGDEGREHGPRPRELPPDPAAAWVGHGAGRSPPPPPGAARGRCVPRAARRLARGRCRSVACGRGGISVVTPHPEAFGGRGGGRPCPGAGGRGADGRRGEVMNIHAVAPAGAGPGRGLARPCPAGCRWREAAPGRVEPGPAAGEEGGRARGCLGGSEGRWAPPRAECRPPRLPPLQTWPPAGRAVPAALPAAAGRALPRPALAQRPDVPDAARRRLAG